MSGFSFYLFCFPRGVVWRDFLKFMIFNTLIFSILRFKQNAFRGCAVVKN
jgi:hypothetical protein